MTTESTTGSETPRTTDPLMDVLIRGIDTLNNGLLQRAARQVEGETKPSELEPPGVTICPLLYVHW